MRIPSAASLAAAFLTCFAAAALAGCGEKGPSAAPPTSPGAAKDGETAGGGEGAEGPAGGEVKATDRPIVALDIRIGEEKVGTIKIELRPDKAPISVKNFLDYVEAKHYDGLIFHRVMPTFMIQGGGVDAELNERPTRAPIKNEADNGLSNERGTVAMARTRAVDSATAQFFINVVDNGRKLDYAGPDSFGYAVFGKVVEGMEIADRIKDLPTGPCPPLFREDCPETRVVIESARRLK